MRTQTAILRLLVGISTLVTGFATSEANAHIDFKGDFECKSSYEKDCYLFSAEIDRRTIWMFFDGTEAENGKACEIRTATLSSELSEAVLATGGKPGDVAITSIRYNSAGERGIQGEYRCSYEIMSKRKDLRFQSHHYNRRFWTNSEERNGICMDDVSKAKSIPGSIGAAKWMTAALAQGQICNINYATLGFDRTESGSNGIARLVKYGSEPTNSEVKP